MLQMTQELKHCQKRVILSMPNQNCFIKNSKVNNLCKKLGLSCFPNMERKTGAN